MAKALGKRGETSKTRVPIARKGRADSLQNFSTKCVKYCFLDLSTGYSVEKFSLFTLIPERVYFISSLL